MHASNALSERKAGWPQGAVLIAAGLLPIMAVSSFLPAIPTMLKHFAGTPNVQLLIPLMVSAPGLMVALLAPIAGKLTDSFGRRKLLVLSCLFYGLFGALPFILSDMVPIFLCRLGVGATEAFVLTIANTLIADYFDEKGRRLLLTVQAVFSPMFGAGIVIVSGALTEWQWNGTFLIYLLAFPIFLSVLLLTYEPDRRQIGQSTGPDLSTLQFLRLCSGFLLATMFISIVFFVYAIQAGRAFDAVGVTSPQQIGYLIAITNIGLPLGGLTFAVLKRLPHQRLVLILFLINGLGMAAMGLARDAISLTAFTMFQQVGGGMTVAVMILWAQGILPPEWRGRGMGLWSCAFFFGQFASPVAFSMAMAPSGRPLDAFLIVGGVTLLVTAIWALAGGVGRGKPALNRQAAH